MNEAVQFLIFLIFIWSTPLLMAVFAQRWLRSELKPSVRVAIWVTYIFWLLVWAWFWTKQSERTREYTLGEMILVASFWVLAAIGITLMSLAERKRLRFKSSRGFEIKVTDHN